jgi:beta-galactosidase GanA
MNFEEWWWPRKPLGDELISGDVVTTAARAAWGARDAEINELKKANSKLAEAAIVPNGYVLVPVEPTTAMIEAGLEVHPWDYTEDMQKIYKAMIQAAQEEV